MKIIILLSMLLNSSFINLTADRRPSKVGDVLSVIIVENIRASHQDQKQLSKTSDVKGSFSTNIFGLNPNYKLDENGSTNSKGAGSIEASSSFTGNLTAVIEEILPDGNFKIKATQKINIDGEEKKVILNGIVHPFDIKPGNIVYSYNIYNLDISYESKGSIKSVKKRGLLNFLLGWLF